MNRAHLFVSLALLILVVCVPAHAETHRFRPTRGYTTYAVREPVLRIKPGDIVETNSLASGWYFGNDDPDPNAGHTGPFYIEGATPNDTLVVRILKLRPSIDTGRSGTS